MTDAEYETTKAKLLGFSDAWVQTLGLGAWRIFLTWERDGYSDRGHSAEGNYEDRKSGAYTVADWRYMEAEITFNVPGLYDMEPHRLEEIFVHELCHVLLSEMHRDDVTLQAHEERTCTQLAKAFLWVRDKEPADAAA